MNYKWALLKVAGVCWTLTQLSYGEGMVHPGHVTSSLQCHIETNHVHFAMSRIFSDHFHSNRSISSENRTNLLRYIIHDVCTCASRRSVVHYLYPHQTGKGCFVFFSAACFGKTASVYILLIFPNFSILVLRSQYVPRVYSLVLVSVVPLEPPSRELQPVCSPLATGDSL